MTKASVPAVGTRGVLMKLKCWGLREPIAAVLQLFARTKISLVGQRLDNNFQTVRVDRRPHHGQ